MNMLQKLKDWSSKMNVKILADSASDLSSKWYTKLNVKVIPVHVFVNGTEFLDGVTISPPEMYDAMKRGERLSTSQPNPQAFEQAFLTSAKTNKPLIYFALSASLSGTCESARIMKRQIKQKYPDAPIHIVDTQCASLGYGLVIMRAAQLAKKGASVEEIINVGTYHATHMEHIFTVDHLEYLHRSGRLSRTVSILGSLLRIKPILHMKKGKLELLENIRGTKRRLSRLIEIAEERGVDFKNQVMGVCHGDDLTAAERLATMCREKLGAQNVIIQTIGAGIGSHAGPGVLALLFLNKPYK